MDFSLEAEYISLLLQASESRFSITFSLNHPNTYTVQWRLVQSETRWRTEPECGFQLQHWCPGTSFCKTLMPLPYKAFPEAHQEVGAPSSGFLCVCLHDPCSHLLSPRLVVSLRMEPGVGPVCIPMVVPCTEWVLEKSLGIQWKAE